MTPTQKDLDRFWVKVDRSGGEDACWTWLAAKIPDGYGQIGWLGKVRLAHRISYELANGRIPAGLEIDHLCSVRSCVNPTHLEAVTHAENVRRGASGGYWRLALTECTHGHAYDEKNTAVTPRGHRRCRTCSRRHAADRRARVAA